MQKSIEIQSNGLTLRGMLHIPEGATGKVPMVCIFHGFTGNKMEPHFIFVKLSRLLASKGIASVRFDFSGSGESDGDFVDMTISKELDEAKSILEYVKTLEITDCSKIGILGLSMGGAVASMLAGECERDIQTLCLWAPAGNMGELVLRGRSEEELRLIEKIGHADLGGLSLGAGFITDVINKDIFVLASPYTKNVMILHGDLDQSVPLEVSDRYLEIYETRATLHVIEGADHTFNNLAWESEVLDYTLGFLEEELLEL